MPSTPSSQPTTRACRITGLVAFLLFANTLQAQGPGGEPVETYEKVLVSQMPSPELAGYFERNEEIMAVPISYLRASLAQEATAVQISPDQLSQFVAHINHAASDEDRRRCNISPATWGSPPPDPEGPKETHVLDAVLAQQNLLLGTIEHITSTWDFHYKSLTSLVFVRIDEVLRDDSGGFAVGQLVTYIRWWGEDTVLGVTLCTDPPFDVAAEEMPQVGDQILLTGPKDLWNPNHIVALHTRIYPVAEGVVSPPEGASGYSQQTTTVAEIRSRLHC